MSDAEYAFLTTWRINTPLEAVWEAIYHVERWATWWWMNWLAPLARPFFAWNHDAVMRQGEQGLKRLLEPPR